MIRPVAHDDVPTVISLAVASGLFAPGDDGIVETMMADYFARERDHGHACAIDLDDDGEPVAVAYWEPAKATDRSWYLTMIGVRQDRHRRGRGAALLEHVEQQLSADGQRLLLVETSSTPAFDRARSFYRSCGYDEEARVRDYYERGDDMVLFRKALTRRVGDLPQREQRPAELRHSLRPEVRLPLRLDLRDDRGGHR